jgi:predicted transglutaminase-like cysteine proteinase
MQSENEAQASGLDEKASDLAEAHQELDELHCQCHDKDAQLCKLKEMNKEAEKLTQDVMRDLHNVESDINKYASIVNQQELELVSERTRHSDEAREKDDEISNLQTQRLLLNLQLDAANESQTRRDGCGACTVRKDEAEEQESFC